MALIQAFKNKFMEMAREDAKRSAQAPARDFLIDPERLEASQSFAKTPAHDEVPVSSPTARNSRGIALLMVLAAISVLSFLVTEFSYVAQLNQKLAFDALDQVKATYLAKSGLKLSLLRLKAYQTVKGLVGGAGGNNGSGNNAANAAGGAGAGGISSSALDQIWSFPFMYPIPTSLPGLSPDEVEEISKFQKKSGLEGSFTAIIESESSKLNLNMILPDFAGTPSPSPSPSTQPTNPTPPPGQPNQPNPGASPSPTPTFNADEARKSLQTYFQNIMDNKAKDDPDFQDEYRDFRMEDFMDNLAAWADPTYQRKQSGYDDAIPMKQAPFYSVSELHMIPGMDDELYNLFAPGLTVSRTQGVNINTMKEVMLRALVPQMTDDEVKEFFKYRDDPDQDNRFKNADDFYKYLSNSVAAFKGNEQAINQLKDDLKKRNIRLVTDETEFKITVRATVNQSVKTLEAWVSLTGDTNKTQSSNSDSNKNSSNNSNNNQPYNPQSGTPQDQNGKPTPDAGLRINFMRIS